ncbi:MAG: hypothetical protein ACLUQW_09135 [Collinsella sp.]
MQRRPRHQPPLTVALSPAGSDGDFGEPQSSSACATSRPAVPAYVARSLSPSFELADDLAHTVIDLGDVYGVRPRTRRTNARHAHLPALPLATGAYRRRTQLAIDVINTLDHATSDIFALTEPVAPSGVLGPVTLLGQNLPK